jgi:CTP synthase
VVCRKLGLGAGEPDMRHWRELVAQIHAAEQRHVTIALVGKYTELHDAYLSVVEALKHAGFAHDTAVQIDWGLSYIAQRYGSPSAAWQHSEQTGWY